MKQLLGPSMGMSWPSQRMSRKEQHCLLYVYAMFLTLLFVPALLISHLGHASGNFALVACRRPFQADYYLLEVFRYSGMALAKPDCSLMPIDPKKVQCRGYWELNNEGPFDSQYVRALALEMEDSQSCEDRLFLTAL
mmetsp:Transcript_25973/g.47084  ORF Transcript_25973/g.47084 Transcript_25973/m.47084 type:complete len:137 (+) Transcript_25973:428-838(+)